MDVFIRIPVPPARPVILVPPARTHCAALLLLWFVTVSCCLPRVVLLNTCVLVRKRLAYVYNYVSVKHHLRFPFSLAQVSGPRGEPYGPKMHPQCYIFDYKKHLTVIPHLAQCFRVILAQKWCKTCSLKQHIIKCIRGFVGKRRY